MRKRAYMILLLAALLCGCSGRVNAPVQTVDPYAGMVQVESGYGTKMWVKEHEGLPVNPLRDTVLGETEEIIDENGARYDVRVGVDVSEHQGEIDWAALRAENQIDFALLRAGYRGYGEAGRLVEDAYFAENMAGASANGFDIGVYFFSQATSVAEAEEEADFLLELLRPYARESLRLPVFFDWEHINFEPARTDEVSDETLTDCAIAFCERLRAAGFEAGIYAYRYLAYYNYDLPRIAPYPLWIAATGDKPDFYYAFDIWQCSIEGAFSGIAGPVDVDMIFIPAQETAPPPAPDAQSEIVEIALTDADIAQ